MDNFTFYCNGHSNIRATHKTTLEFTKDEKLTTKGNCILGINCSRSLNNIHPDFKEKLKKSSARILVKIQVENLIDIIEGYGDSRLELSDKNAIIIRKSDFVCSKTLMIKSDKAARDISNEIREIMKDHNSKMKVTIQIKE